MIPAPDGGGNLHRKREIAMFQGYTQGAIDFLWGLRLNNERSWFQAHKEEFTALVDRPTRELAEQLREEMTEAFPKLGLELKVSRIYRDARRLFGRGPYKDHLWLSISQPADQWECRPVFWFELAPEEYSFGLGYWMAQALTLAKFRARMDRDPKTMEKMARAIESQGTFRLQGETFKRPKEAPSKLLEPWYNRKGGFSLSCERPHDDLLWSPDLPEYILTEWEKLVPLYRYLSTLDGDPDPRDGQ